VEPPLVVPAAPVEEPPVVVPLVVEGGGSQRLPLLQIRPLQQFD
jgi:hypothetical protein